MCAVNMAAVQVSQLRGVLTVNGASSQHNSKTADLARSVSTRTVPALSFSKSRGWGCSVNASPLLLSRQDSRQNCCERPVQTAELRSDVLDAEESFHVQQHDVEAGDCAMQWKSYTGDSARVENPMLERLNMREMNEGDMWREECGVVGIFGDPEASRLCYLALHALQHRGQEGAGIVTSDNGTLHTVTGKLKVCTCTPAHTVFISFYGILQSLTLIPDSTLEFHFMKKCSPQSMALIFFVTVWVNLKPFAN